MKHLVCKLEFITRAFCGGADPARQAEVRAPAIRGVLRWGFRALGGFKSLAPLDCRVQESHIFGSAADAGNASPLQVRVKLLNRPVVEIKNAEQLGCNMNSPEGYLLFPLRQNARALFNTNNLPSNFLF